MIFVVVWSTCLPGFKGDDSLPRVVLEGRKVRVVDHLCSRWANWKCPVDERDVQVQSHCENDPAPLVAILYCAA